MYDPKPEAVEPKIVGDNKVPMKISGFPEFAEICCFINHFGEKLGVMFTFPRIARLLSCETDADLQSLTTLVVKLLNKMRLRTQLNRWQPALGRFLQRHAYNCDELRSIGDGLNNGSPPTLFFSLAPQRRLRVLLFCLETQFHLNVPFKEKVKTIDSHTLRTPPLGVDIFGNSYWLLVDTECNFLLYRSSAEDMTLELLSDSFSTLETVIEDLKDEKYEKTPISELYSVFRIASKQEPTGPINFPSPPTLPDIVAPREVKLDESDVYVKPETAELPDGKPEETEEEEKAKVEGVITKKCAETPTAPADEKPISGLIACEDAVPQADFEQRQTEQQSSVKEEGSQEALGPRRSGRKRKQVEFLAMESFNKGKRSRGKKSISISTSKKSRRAEGKLKEDKSRKKKASKKRKRRRRGKNPRNGQNGSSGCLWTRSPEDSETDNEEDEEEDLWNDVGSNGPDNSGSSLQDGEKQSPRDWLEDLESDFDLEAEDGGDSGVVAGRNLQRQKSQVLDEAPCQICTESNHPEWLLLCDSCDLGFHAQCLRPALHLIPEGDWFCPRCLHTRLVIALVEQLSTLQARSKKLDSAARMQERLNFVNISVTNILRDERTRRPVVDSDSSSVESEESSRQTRRRRSRYYESSGSTSDDVSSSDENGDDDEEEEDDDDDDDEDKEEEEDELPARITRHRNIHYNVNAAFQQLDEVLVEDEKYAQERLERSKAKNQHSDHEEEGKDESAACGGPPLPGSVVPKTAKRKRLSSSSASSDSEGRERSKRRRRVSPGSEEFRPSDESENDEDEDEEYEEEVEPNSSTVESVSSDQSWNVNRRRRSRRHGRLTRRSRHRRGGRPSKGRRGRRIPHFEGPSSDEDGEESVPLRRSSRVRVNYREIESSEEEEEEGAGGKEVAVTKNSSERRANTASSGSEYAPSEEAEGVEEEGEEERDVEGVEASSLAVKIPPIMSTQEEDEILQISNPVATSREFGNNNEPQIEEDSMDMVKDDPIFQNFVIDELVLPIQQETENASDMQRHSPTL
ncbi:remodeling and spacing factor 1 [Echinococcus multilocularis]|uniref:Remodeling and spacing factor 1 n=1 Tax=Echinococcus multilocularis TaxID=6211 RepID=A0A068YEZ8_ECHMU|nr:remodeling and spacing factor 1 [Echinococcus multilocularis]